MSTRSVTAAMGLALVTGLAGCSGPQTGIGAPAPTSRPAPTAAPAPATSDPRAEPVPPSGPAPDALAQPLASTQAPIPLRADPQATVKVDLLGLQRQDRLLVLTAALTPQNTTSGEFTLFDMLGSQSFRPQLIDTGNLKLYEVVRAGNELRSKDLGNRVPSGTPLFVHATFAAPPPEVSRINVQIIDNIPAFANVPIR